MGRLTTSAGTNSAAITTNCVISDVPWNTSNGMGCHNATCSMNPLINASTHVPNTGRHNRALASRTASQVMHSVVAGHISIQGLASAIEVKNTTQHNGTYVTEGSSVMMKYTGKLVRLENTTYKYAARIPSMLIKRAHTRPPTAAAAPSNAPDKPSQGSIVPAGTSSTNCSSIPMTKKTRQPQYGSHSDESHRP